MTQGGQQVSSSGSGDGSSNSNAESSSEIPSESSSESRYGTAVVWKGGTAAVRTIREILLAHAPTGVLRLVLQQLTLHEQGREAGLHEVIFAISDVGGNMVTVPLREAVREDPAAARLDAALQRLRSELTAELDTAVDSLEVVLDADGTRRVLVILSVDVSPQEIDSDPPHPALHDGRHHIQHEAPGLDELRDRLAAPPPGPLRRARDAVTGFLRRIRLIRRIRRVRRIRRTR